jgi:hypothetical protein
MKEVDYSTHTPDSILDFWRKDYEVIRSSMIYGDSLSFNKLMEKIPYNCSRTLCIYSVVSL